MTKIKSDWASRLINYKFEPPLFYRAGVEDQFFGMVYRALSPILTVNVQDFSTLTRTNPSDPFARYQFFGGPCTVSLSYNILSMNFPDQGPADTELILRIVDALNNEFMTEFPPHNLTSVDVVVASHCTVLDPGGASSYLKRFAVPAASKLPDVTHTPGAHFSLQDRHGAWRARCMVEQSEVLSDGVFVMLDTAISQITEKNLESQLTVFNNALSACMRALEMEMEDA